MALVNGGQVFEPFQTVSLGPPLAPLCRAGLVFVELGAGNPSLATGLANIAQGLGQLQDAQLLPGDLLFRCYSLPPVLSEYYAFNIRR